MKKLIAVSMIVISVSACSANQWQQFLNNAPAYVTRFEQSVQTLLSFAASVYNAVISFLPADTQAKIAQDYALAVSEVNHAILALDSAVAADEQAQNPNPNYAQLFADIGAAVDQLSKIVNEIESAQIKTVKPSVTGSSSYVDYKNELAIVQRYITQKK